jgi:hypothetical protein
VRAFTGPLETPVLRYSEEPDFAEESGSSKYLRTGVVGGPEVMKPLLSATPRHNDAFLLFFSRFSRVAEVFC